MGTARQKFLIKGKWVITGLIFAITLRLPAPPPNNPTISDIPDQRTFNDTATRPIRFVIGDAQTPAENLTLSASSSNTGLVPASKIVFSGSGSNRFVTITPTTGVNGSAAITVNVKDGNGKTASDSFTLSVGGFTPVPLGQIGLAYGASAWGDYNNDGLLDLLMTGAGPGYNPNTKLLRNNGNGSFTEILNSLPPVWYGAVAWGDYDNDGDLDVLLAGASSDNLSTKICRIYRHDGNGVFTDINAGFLGGSGGSVAWVDFDNDGDLDAFSTGSPATQLYRNNGGVFTIVPTIFPAVIKGKAVWGDYDNDGDKDVFIIGDLGGLGDIARIYRNDGAGGFAVTAVNLATGYDSTAMWGDYDNDGDLDLGTTGGSRDTGFPRIYRNNGNDSFVSIPASFPAVESGSTTWADFDNDGNLDFTITGLNSNDTTITSLFFNRGSNQFNRLNTPQIRGVWNGETTWADFDNDSDVDLLVAGYQIGASAVFALYRNDGAMPNSPPVAPTNLGSGTAGGNVLLSWTAPADLNQSGGFSYNLRMGTSPGAINIISPMANLNTGFRRIVAMGNAGQHPSWTITNLSAGTYYWSVQAIDNSFAGSPFAVEQSFTLSAPTILSHPKDLTVTDGQDAFFVVTANGTQPMQYQLRFNGVDMFGRSVVGGTNGNFIITGDESPQQGNYSIAVSNAFGSAVSSNAFLTVLHPPSFPQQPQNETRALGGAVNLSALVFGSNPFSFQWFFEGVALTNGGRISGANTFSLVITNLQFSDAGNYSLRASNDAGISNSSLASLTVLAPVAITQLPENKTAVAGSSAQFSVGANGGGVIGYRWRFNGNPLLDGARISGAQSATLTISDLLLGDTGNYSVLVTNEVSSLLISNATLTVIAPPVFTQQATNQNVVAGSNASFAVNASGTLPINYQWFFNDALLVNGGRVSGATNKSLIIAVAQTNDAGNYFVVASNVAGSMTSWVAVLDVGLRPSITVSPASQTNLVSSNVTFTVVADGTGPLNYQWRFNETNFTGATNQHLALTNIQSLQQGNYSAQVSNFYGTTISSNAFLAVLVPLTFTQQPQNQSVVAGSNVDFSVNASGTLPINYQWFFNDALLMNGGRVSGATNNALFVATTLTNDAGHYFVVASNAAGSVTSLVAVLDVGLPPSIMLPPTNQSHLVGSNATFTVVVDGTAPLNYQWRFNGANLAGATNQSLALTNIQSIQQGIYSVQVSNLYGATISSNAFLAVLVSPSFTQQPQNQLVVAGNNAYFTVDTSGTPPISYQWIFDNESLTNGGRISGATIKNLTIAATQTNDAGSYFIVASNVAGSVTSLVAVLNVGLPPSITMSPAGQTNLVGSNVNFNVVVDGTAPLNYQWRFNGTNLLDDNRITGSTTSTLSISNLLITFAGTYTVVVTNLFGSVTSAPAVLTVLVPPTFNVQPVGRSVPVGMPTTFSANLTATVPLTYQWQFNGSNIFNATNSSFAIASVTTNDFGIYTLVASNAVGVSTSAEALLTIGKIVAWGRNDFGQTVVPANLTNVVMLAAGGSGGNPGHSLALRTDGSVIAWGNNSAGQTNVPAGLTNVVAIAAGGLHSMALRSDGKVFAWGSNANGQTNVSNLSNIVAVTAGANHCLALRSDGKLFGWGNNQLNVSSFPADFKAIANGANHNFAIRNDGTLVTWGNNSWNLTNPPAGMNDLVGMAGGVAHSVVLRANGTAIGWGSLSYNATNVPASLTNGIMITAGDYYSAALRSSGTAIVWGQNSHNLFNVPAAGSNLVRIAGGGAHMLGLIGDDAPLIVQRPIGNVNYVGRDAVLSGKAIGAMPLNYQWRFNGVDIPDATNATLSLLNLAATNAGDYQLVVSNAFGIATSVPAPLTILDNPVLTFLTQPPAAQTNFQGSKVTLKFSVSGNGPLKYQWRLNGTNIAGATNQEFVFDPILFENAGNYSAVISNQSISRTSSGLMQRVQTIRTWGYLDDYYNYYFSQNPIVTNVVSVAAGLTHSLALRDDGKIQGWGINQFGEINPPAALSNATVTAIAAGHNFSLALRSDGIPFAWGYNSYGQINVPASATNVTAIACGYFHSLALRSDGTAVGWGNNSYGQINVPVAATNLTAIAASQYHSLGLRANGTIIAWGHLGYGLSGMPQNATNLIAIAAGSTHNLALRTDGTVIAWGMNTRGQTNVPAGLSNVVAISASGMHSVALRSDGTVVYWGSYTPGGTSGSATTPSDLENFIQIADGGDRSVGILGTRAPAITIQPFNRVVLSGSNTLLTARAVGAQPVSYQWLFNGADVVGATNVSLVLTNVEFAQAGAYQLSVSNSYGTSASKPAKLVVSLPLGEALDAANLTWSSPGGEQWFGQTSSTHDGVDAARSGSINHNRNSVLQTSVNGPAQISFWWKVSSEAVFDVLEFRLNGIVQAVISGEEDWQQQTFAIPSGSNTLQWRYAKDASSSAGQDAGWVDQFVYMPGPPIITVQPIGKTVNMGSNVQFIVTATGVGPFNYQWRKDVTNVVGINSATLFLNNVGRAHSGIYFLTITNAGGSATSSNAVLNVLVPQRLETPLIQPDGTLLIAARDADGNPLSGADLANMQIQASTNLIDWMPLPGTLVLTNGNLEFHDPDATNLLNRFYRTVETP